jgi:hypothetical protein
MLMPISLTHFYLLQMVFVLPASAAEAFAAAALAVSLLNVLRESLAVYPTDPFTQPHNYKKAHENEQQQATKCDPVQKVLR